MWQKKRYNRFRLGILPLHTFPYFPLIILRQIDISMSSTPFRLGRRLFLKVAICSVEMNRQRHTMLYRPSVLDAQITSGHSLIVVMAVTRLRGGIFRHSVVVIGYPTLSGSTTPTILSIPLSTSAFILRRMVLGLEWSFSARLCLDCSASCCNSWINSWSKLESIRNILYIIQPFFVKVRANLPIG